jgi:hypothetical protein
MIGDKWLVRSIVLVVLATAALVVYDHLRPVRRPPAPLFKTRATLGGLNNEIYNYWIDLGHFPSGLSDLFESGGRYGWNPRRMQGIATNDGWGRPIKYTILSTNRFELRSFGPDGIEGDKDDVVRSNRYLGTVDEESARW